MNKYEKYYTSKNAIQEIIHNLNILKKNNIIKDNIYYIDTSCGNNNFVKMAYEKKIIKDNSSYEIMPDKTYYGEIIQKNWLNVNTNKKNVLREKCNYLTMIGVNPPYGYGSKKAKEFIYKGFIEEHDFCVWLVPISLKMFLLKLYDNLFMKEFIQLEFLDKMKDEKIKQSVLLFIGKIKRDMLLKDHKTIFLSRLKKNVVSKYDYILKRTHNTGIRNDVCLILKKTGNPVFFPSFFCPDISKNIWWQINKTGIVKKNANLEKKNKKYIMNGIRITKHIKKDHTYSVDSNIYVKISKLNEFICMEKFIKTIIKFGNTNDFFKMVNVYKPAAITMGWLRSYLDEYIKNNKIDSVNN